MTDSGVVPALRDWRVTGESTGEATLAQGYAPPRVAWAKGKHWRRAELRPSRRRVGQLAAVAAGLAALAATAIALGAPNPLNDLFALGQAGGDTPPTAPRRQAKTRLHATPLVKKCA